MGLPILLLRSVGTSWSTPLMVVACDRGKNCGRDSWVRKELQRGRVIGVLLLSFSIYFAIRRSAVGTEVVTCTLGAEALRPMKRILYNLAPAFPSMCNVDFGVLYICTPVSGRRSTESTVVAPVAVTVPNFASNYLFPREGIQIKWWLWLFGTGVLRYERTLGSWERWPMIYLAQRWIRSWYVGWNTICWACHCGFLMYRATSKYGWRRW